MTFEEFVAQNHPNAPKADVNNMRLGWNAGIAAAVTVPEPSRDPNARTRASDVENALPLSQEFVTGVTQPGAPDIGANGSDQSPVPVMLDVQPTTATEAEIAAEYAEGNELASDAVPGGTDLADAAETPVDG